VSATVAIIRRGRAPSRRFLHRRGRHGRPARRRSGRLRCGGTSGVDQLEAQPRGVLSTTSNV